MKNEYIKLFIKVSYKKTNKNKKALINILKHIKYNFLKIIFKTYQYFIFFISFIFLNNLLKFHLL